MQMVNGTIALIGRILMAMLFIGAGVSKAMNIGATMVYMALFGLPASVAWPAAIFEIVMGVFLLLGIFTRFTALMLAGFCVITALIFHSNFADPIQTAMFMKNFAIAGGLLVLMAYNGIWYSWDALRQRRRAEQTTTVTVVPAPAPQSPTAP